MYQTILTLEVLSDNQVLLKQGIPRGTKVTWHSNLGYPMLCFNKMGLSRGQFGYFELKKPIFFKTTRSPTWPLPPMLLS